MDPTFKETYYKITVSEKFKNFIKEHPHSKLCAGFFIMDFLSNDTKRSLDYTNEGVNKVFTFELNDLDDVFLKKDELMETASEKLKLTPIEPNPKIELDELKSIVGARKLEEGISAHLHKIIAVLQNYEGKLFWNLTCMLDQLIILHVLVDATTGEIAKFERKSMMDFIRKQK